MPDFRPHKRVQRTEMLMRLALSRRTPLRRRLLPNVGAARRVAFRQFLQAQLGRRRGRRGYGYWLRRQPELARAFFAHVDREHSHDVMRRLKA